MPIVHNNHPPRRFRHRSPLIKILGLEKTHIVVDIGLRLPAVFGMGLLNVDAQEGQFFTVRRVDFVEPPGLLSKGRSRVTAKYQRHRTPPEGGSC